MKLTIIAGAANLPLALSISGHPGFPLARRVLEEFPDGERHVEIQESVRGHDVYLVQPTGPPVDQNLIALVMLADACRRAGAGRVTAVIPYFGYARQDRRGSGREAVGGRVVADLLATSGIDRVVALDLHTPAIEGFFTIPLEHLTAVPTLAEASRPLVGESGVIVAPDLGAAKLADRYARLLHLPVAVVHKTRISGEAVTASDITGDVRERIPLVVDDMISTAGTVEAAIQVALAHGCRPEVTVVASHGLFVNPAALRLRALPIQQILVTDSVEPPGAFPVPLQTVSIAPLLAEAVQRLNRDEPLDDLILHV